MPSRKVLAERLLETTKRNDWHGYLSLCCERLRLEEEQREHYQAYVAELRRRIEEKPGESFTDGFRTWEGILLLREIHQINGFPDRAEEAAETYWYGPDEAAFLRSQEQLAHEPL
jgi:hypothetical protein